MAKKDVTDIRRERLRELMRVRGGPGALAKKLGYSSGSYLSQVAGPTPTREISERVARSMEKLLGLPDGYFDHEEGAPPPGGTKLLPVGDTVRAVMGVIEESGLQLSGAKIAEVVALAYDQAASAGRVDRAYVQRLLKLVG